MALLDRVKYPKDVRALDRDELEQLVREVRERHIDVVSKKGGHFTYVVLLTAQDDMDAMSRAFADGVDDFLNKSNLRAQLLPRVHAAQRIAARLNELLRTNKMLRKRVRELQSTDLVDPVTGLGNLKFAHWAYAISILAEREA